jgi:hypothetical protein
MRESRTSGSGRGDQGNPVPYRHVRRETGKEQMVRVHYDEGAAIHIGPECDPAWKIDPCRGVIGVQL